ncbi:MAG: hypothetical protein OEL89_05090, partial [Candidatus Peregrinibacteria bacterium]|nr:hypothetical protein [Candidatus Peregrinibacteria bacterium]
SIVSWGGIVPENTSILTLPILFGSIIELLSWSFCLKKRLKNGIMVGFLKLKCNTKSLKTFNVKIKYCCSLR